MSNPETESSRPRLTLDDLTKMLALTVALISAGKYFYDKAEVAAHEARTRSISYIESYGVDPVLEAREALYTFWAGQPELIKIFGNQALSERQYKTMLYTTLFHKIRDLRSGHPRRIFL